MWEYTEKVKDYYRNPKNVGSIEDADAVAEVGSLSCGDAMKIFLKIDKAGIITDAKFQTFGCGSAVASASALTEMIIGKTIDEASKVTNQDIADFLGGLPEQKMHCSVLGEEALEAAIANYHGQKIPEKEHDRIICRCFGITEKKLKHVIEENQLTNIEGVTNYCKAGGACGKCHADIQEVLDAETAKRQPQATKKPLSKTKMIIQVNNILENYIAPELRKDGGDIELIDIEDSKIIVNLQGSCKNCPSSNLTLKNFVENILKEHLGPEITVVEG